MEENAENTATTPPVSETIQENAENSERQQQHSEPIVAAAETAAAEPKRRGRPAGAKDKQPRKQKPRVVEVDIAPPPQASAPAPAQPSEPTPAPAQPSEPEPAQPSEPEPDPMTPRRMYRETATHLAHLKTLINSQKRQALGEMYTKKLMTLVQ